MTISTEKLERLLDQAEKSKSDMTLVGSKDLEAICKELTKRRAMDRDVAFLVSEVDHHFRRWKKAVDGSLKIESGEVADYFWKCGFEVGVLGLKHVKKMWGMTNGDRKEPT